MINVTCVIYVYLATGMKLTGLDLNNFIYITDLSMQYVGQLRQYVGQFQNFIKLF